MPVPSPSDSPRIVQESKDIGEASPKNKKPLPAPASQESAPIIEFVRKTPSGEIIVKVEGVQYKLVDAETILLFLKIEAENESLKDQNKIFADSLQKIRDLKDEEIKKLIANYEKKLKNEFERTKNAEDRADNNQQIGNKKGKLAKTGDVIGSPVTRGVLLIAQFLLNLFK